MDSEKLLRILKDLQHEETVLGINGKIEAIKNSLAQNNPEGFENAKKQTSELLDEVKGKALSYKYSRTENLLLDRLGGTRYFGAGLVGHLGAVFAAPNFEVISNLDTYRTQRNEFIKKIKQLGASLVELGFEEYRPDTYEVGVVLPDEEGDLNRLLKRMRELKLLLEALAEATGNNRDSVKITRASNGSLELFSLQPAEIALLLTSLLLNVSTIWEKVVSLQKNKKEFNNNGYTKETNQKLEAVLDEEAEKIKIEILDELPDKILKDSGHKLEDGRRNEVRNQIRASLKAVFGWFELGIEIDVTPVRIAPGENTEATPQDPKAIEIANKIGIANDRLRPIYELSPELLKLPFQLPAPEDTETEPEPKKEAKPVAKAPQQEKKVIESKEKPPENEKKPA